MISVTSQYLMSVNDVLMFFIIFFSFFLFLAMSATNWSAARRCFAAKATVSGALMASASNIRGGNETGTVVDAGCCL